MKQLKVIVFVFLMAALASCAKLWQTDEDPNSQYRGMSAKQLYAESKSAITAGQYATASKRLEALESMYPFSDYAEKAQLNLIYAYYKNEDYASAAATADRFIHLYPRAQRVDYAYYLKGLANFQQNRGTFAKWLPMDESWRAPGTQALAYSDFATLIQRFPNSRYKANALQRMIYLRNMFAQRELNAATYYYDRNMYVAAVERAGFLVKNYPQAPSVEKALLVLRDANLALGLNKAAEEAVAVYEATYHKKPNPALA